MLPFIIQSVHYKAISTTYVIEPKVLHFFFFFWRNLVYSLSCYESELGSELKTIPYNCLVC